MNHENTIIVVLALSYVRCAVCSHACIMLSYNANIISYHDFYNVKRARFARFEKILKNSTSMLLVIVIK